MQSHRTTELQKCSARSPQKHTMIIHEPLRVSYTKCTRMFGELNHGNATRLTQKIRQIDTLASGVALFPLSISRCIHRWRYILSELGLLKSGTCSLPKFSHLNCFAPSPRGGNACRTVLLGPRSVCGCSGRLTDGR